MGLTLLYIFISPFQRPAAATGRGHAYFRGWGGGAWNLKGVTLGLELVGAFNKMAESGVSPA